jgi:hypothetical protein
MQEIQSSVDIDASAEMVRFILTPAAARRRAGLPCHESRADDTR